VFDEKIRRRDARSRMRREALWVKTVEGKGREGKRAFWDQKNV